MFELVSLINKGSIKIAIPTKLKDQNTQEKQELILILESKDYKEFQRLSNLDRIDYLTSRFSLN